MPAPTPEAPSTVDLPTPITPEDESASTVPTALTPQPIPEIDPPV